MGLISLQFQETVKGRFQKKEKTESFVFSRQIAEERDMGISDLIEGA